MRLSRADETAPGAYGLVCVVNPDGSFNRHVKISVAEFRALNTGKSKGKIGAFPSVVTREEYLAGQVTWSGPYYPVGACQEGDGMLGIKLREEVSRAGRVVEVHALLRAGEWSGELPDIDVPEQKVQEIDKTRDTREAREHTIVAVKGELTTTTRVLSDATLTEAR